MIAVFPAPGAPVMMNLLICFPSSGTSNLYPKTGIGAKIEAEKPAAETRPEK
jgi:hypothetical protein